MSPHVPWSDLWSPYFDANHHVLYTFLAKLSVSLLGASELSMRLPSLIAGLAMMIGIYRVSKRLEARINPLLDKASGIMDRARAIVDDAGPRIRDMIEKAQEHDIGEALKRMKAEQERILREKLKGLETP